MSTHKLQLIRGLHNIKPQQRACVATIGNFDGLHLGHQAVIEQVAAQAASMNLPATLIVFEPQPLEFFHGKTAPARLTRLREKLLVLRESAIDNVLCLHFDASLAALTPQAFIQHILVDGLAVKYLVVGDDFHFGKDRVGDFGLLTQLGERYGFTVASMHTVNQQDERVSSTRIRYALETGDLDLAKRLLGRPYSMCGRVTHGDKRGRLIGFPTANIYLHRHVTPVLGVYAVTVHGLAVEPLYGVANVGKRPTVDGTRSLLEVHIFDFDQDIYGRYIEVEFVMKLRDEKRFDSFDLLKAQIFKDAQQARTFFGQ